MKRVNMDMNNRSPIEDPHHQMVPRTILDKRIGRLVFQFLPICRSCKYPYEFNIDGSGIPVEIGKRGTVKCPKCGTEYVIFSFRTHDQNAPVDVFIHNAFTVES